MTYVENILDYIENRDIMYYVENILELCCYFKTKQVLVFFLFFFVWVFLSEN